MNNPNTFALGWGLFAAGTFGGAYLGYRRSQDQLEKRKLENIEHTRRRNEKLDKLEEDLRKNNSKLFRNKKNSNISNSESEKTTESDHNDNHNNKSN